MPVQQYGEMPHANTPHSEVKPRAVDYSRELNEILPSERCDHKNCNSQAYIMATSRVGNLVFCRHHGNPMVSSLLEQGFAIQDETFKLNKR